MFFIRLRKVFAHLTESKRITSYSTGHLELIVEKYPSLIAGKKSILVCGTHSDNCVVCPAVDTPAPSISRPPISRRASDSILAPFVSVFQAIVGEADENFAWSRFT